MADYQDVASTTGTDASGEGTIPATSTFGDALVAAIYHAASAVTLNSIWPGWNSIRGDPDPADFSMWCLGKVYTSGDSNPTFGFSAAGNWAIDIIAIRGSHPTAPIDVASSAIGATINSITSTSVDPSVNGCVAILFAGVDATGGARTWGVSPSMTERVDRMDNALHRVAATEVLSGHAAFQRTASVSGSAQDMGCFMVVVKPTSGTQYTQATAGEFTSGGVLVKMAGKPLSGGTNLSGIVAKLAAKSFAGTLFIEGNPAKLTSKSFAGEFTSSGVLATIKTVLKSIDGAITFAGNVASMAMKSLTGSFTSSGNIVMQTLKGLAGEFTSSGNVVKQTLKGLAGNFTSSGIVAATKMAYQALAGAITFVGGVAAEKLGPVVQEVIKHVLSLGRRGRFLRWHIIEPSPTAGGLGEGLEGEGAIEVTEEFVEISRVRALFNRVRDTVTGWFRRQ